MINDEIIATKNSGEFITANKEKIDVISNLQNQLVHIDDSSFLKIIEYITKHKNILFIDHPSIIFFFKFIVIFSKYNFKKMELILDIIIQFSDDIKNELMQVTECELLYVCILNYIVSINYLFFKGFFSIATIVNNWRANPYIFYSFLPEIKDYDYELAQLIEKEIEMNIKDEYKTYYQPLIFAVQSNYKKHISNRNLCFHPSLLHKSIREDDIEIFQKLISQNGIKLNDTIEFSFYERAETKEKNICPLKVAAVYGSIKIFKFLLMNNANIDDDLLEYAYFGSNIEIIHLIENKCHNNNCYIESIYNFHYELLDYFIDNFGSEIVENKYDTKILQFHSLLDGNEDNQYDILNYNAITAAIDSLNYPIIISCLQKIAFFAMNAEIIEEKGEVNNCLLINSAYDLDLFKFYINQIKQSMKMKNYTTLINNINCIIIIHLDDAFKYLFFILKDYLNIYPVFQKCIEFNSEMTNFLLDLQIIGNEKKEDIETNSIFNELKDRINYSDIECAFKKYDENVIVKMIQLYDPIQSIDDISSFIKIIERFLSTKMIFSLFERLCKILRRDKLVYIAAAFEDNKKYSISEFIKKKLPKKIE